ncbi:MAG: arginase family protein [Sandaracinaceae bacterium]
MLDLGELLRPAGGGIHVVTTGLSSQRALQRRLYGVDDDGAIDAAWRRALDGIEGARVVVLGVPSDVGAGFARGASFAPQALRETLLERGDSAYHDPAVVDIGDVLVVPQLLHDEMLDASQLRASREAMFGDPGSPLPVSPLSAAEAALLEVRRRAPDARVLLLGGDHSVGWPGLAAVASGRERQVGILHFDAHTDLLSERLGVRYCFATWAYHANDRIGRGGRMAQVGVRVSGHPREHWEQTLDLRQVWADEVARRGADAIAEEIAERFRDAGVEGLYLSNDIDGTDPRWAASTGTPEPGGLHPDDVMQISERVARDLPLWGSDLVEVAPPLGHRDPEEPARTLRTAARYLECQLRLSLRSF